MGWGTVGGGGAEEIRDESSVKHLGWICSKSINKAPCSAYCKLSGRNLELCKKTMASSKHSPQYHPFVPAPPFFSYVPPFSLPFLLVFLFLCA